MNGSQATLPSLKRRPLHKWFEQTPCARGSAARAVPLTQGDNVLFELFSPSVRGRAACSAAGGLFNHSKDLLCKGLLSKAGWLRHQLKAPFLLGADEAVSHFNKIRSLRAGLF